MAKKIEVIKASGEKEIYNEDKVRRSIERSGVPHEIEDQLLEKIQGILYPGIPTRKIYDYILSFLDKSAYPQGKGRYSLKQAIMSLGPSGYPFERFLRAIFTSRGFQAEVSQIVQGHCAKHEIDVVAEKDNRHFLVECKFHNRPGVKTDIKVALYVKARFDDIMTAWQEKPDGLVEFSQMWLVTNTKFTNRAVQYGECVGLRLLGWNYPEGDSLREWIESSHLHPITCLFSLAESQKNRLLEEDLVLCQDLVKADHSFLHGLGLADELIEKAVEEARLVCQID